METSRSSPKSSDRWYLHVQGRTVGPLAGEEVAFGLKTGEFLPGDKIANSRHPIWRRISEHPVFGQHVAAENTPRSALLQAPPPPRLLRVKPVSPPRVPEAVPARPVVEKARPEPVAEPQLELKPEPELEPELEPEPELKPAPPPAGASAFHPSLSTSDFLENDPDTNAALEAATRELERALSKLSRPEPAAAPSPAPRAEVSAAIPPRPEVQTVFLAEPAPSRRAAETPESRKRRVIQIELKMPEKPLRWLVAAALVFAVAYFAGSFWRSGDPQPKQEPVAEDQQLIGAESGGLAQPKKTRDLEKFPLPDPSSPTNTPSDPGDPVPRLKAPTRPRRD